MNECFNISTYKTLAFYKIAEYHGAFSMALMTRPGHRDTCIQVDLHSIKAACHWMTHSLTFWWKPAMIFYTLYMCSCSFRLSFCLHYHEKTLRCSFRCHFRTTSALLRFRVSYLHFFSWMSYCAVYFHQIYDTSVCSVMCGTGNTHEGESYTVLSRKSQKMRPLGTHSKV